MSAGHRGPRKRSDSELDDLLDEALANPKIKARLASPYKLITTFDIAMLGSSSIGGRHVYLDRHLKFRTWPYGVLPIAGKRFDVKPPLIRHERLEQALEDELGWPYELSHEVATRWEHRLVKLRGFDPKAYEAVLEPYIKHDDLEKLVKRPLDLDMRPLMAPPRSTAVIEETKRRNNAEKRSHASVGYVEKSIRPNQRCGKCSMFVEIKYGGPACTLVKDKIEAAGWCRRFVAGKLEDANG